MNHVDDSCPEGPFAPGDDWTDFDITGYTGEGQPQYCREGGTVKCRIFYGPQHEPTPDNFSLRQLADPQVLTITGFPPYDGKWVRYKRTIELPTEPTWGIALGEHIARTNGVPYWTVDCWHESDETFHGWHHRWPEDHVLDFIPLTDEQIQRIEAAR